MFLRASSGLSPYGPQRVFFVAFKAIVASILSGTLGREDYFVCSDATFANRQYLCRSHRVRPLAGSSLGAERPIWDCRGRAMGCLRPSSRCDRWSYEHRIGYNHSGVSAAPVSCARRGVSSRRGCSDTDSGSLGGRLDPCAESARPSHSGQCLPLWERDFFFFF